MIKIPTMFYRDESLKGHPVMNKIKPECEWVLNGEGVATKKLDGTNVKIEGGKFYKRQKPASGEYDEASYIEVEPVDPTNRYIVEAFHNLLDKLDGIYEAIGPKIQGNPENFPGHCLIRVVPPDPILNLANVPRDFEGLKLYLKVHDMEGIVFHHPDGRFAKIKKRDFGIKR